MISPRLTEFQPILPQDLPIAKPQWEIEADKNLVEAYRRNDRISKAVSEIVESSNETSENLNVAIQDLIQYSIRAEVRRAKNKAEQNMPFSERVERQKVIILQSLSYLLQKAKSTLREVPKTLQAIAMAIVSIALGVLGYIVYHSVSPVISP